MTAAYVAQPPLDIQRPLDAFSQCHAGITTRLEALGDLPRLAQAAAQARSVASAALALFQDAVLDHHADEENELFPAVLRSAEPGEEKQRVAAMVRRLTDEHRAVEALWRRLEPAVRAAAKGAEMPLDAAELQELVARYAAHASYEEQEFLPLAQEILGRNGNHMAALGLSLHMRHAPPVVGYI
jgi:hypothetical protein